MRKIEREGEDERERRRLRLEEVDNFMIIIHTYYFGKISR